MRIIGTAVLWAAIIAALWLAIASGAFLWLAGLWDNPRIVWWSRPWQWLVYMLRGDGSFSERLYLILSAFVATAPAIAYGRFFLSNPFGGFRPALYGNTGWATKAKMRDGGIGLKRRPF